MSRRWTLDTLRLRALFELEDEWVTPTELGFRLQLGHGNDWVRLALVLERLVVDGEAEIKRPGVPVNREWVDDECRPARRCGRGVHLSAHDGPRYTRHRNQRDGRERDADRPSSLSSRLEFPRQEAGLGREDREFGGDFFS